MLISSKRFDGHAVLVDSGLARRGMSHREANTTRNDEVRTLLGAYDWQDVGVDTGVVDFCSVSGHMHCSDNQMAAFFCRAGVRCT